MTEIRLFHIPGADESSGRISAFDGELDVLIGKQRQTLWAGGFAYAPRGTTHALKNNGSGKVHMIRVHTPGGFERELGK